MNNPFYNRSSITDPIEFFGRSDQLDRIFERLTDERPQCVSILGERRFGKTSLLNYISHPDGRRGRRVRPKTLLIYPRFGANPPRDPCLFVHRLHVALGRELDLDDTDVSTIRTGLTSSERQLESSASLEMMELGLQSSLERLGAMGRNVFFVLDECEAVVRNVPRELLDFFRTLADDSPPVRVGFVVASRLPIDVICPPESHSKFSNLFTHKIRVANFEAGEVDQLLRRPLETSDIRFSQIEEVEIVKSGGRQPLALKIAAYHALEIKAGSERLQAQTLMPRVYEDMEVHSARWWRDFMPEEQTTLLAVAGCQFPKMDADIATQLRTKGFLAGLVTAPEISPPCLAKWISRNALGRTVSSGSPRESPRSAPSSAVPPPKGYPIEECLVRLAQVRTLGRIVHELRGHGERASVVLDVRLKATPILRGLPPAVKSVILRAAGDQERDWRGKARDALLKVFSLKDDRMLTADQKKLAARKEELDQIFRDGIADLLDHSAEIESLDTLRSDNRYAGSLALRFLSDDEWQRRGQGNSDWIDEVVKRHVDYYLSGPLLFDRRP